VKYLGKPFDDLLVHEKIRERLVLLDRAIDYLKAHLFLGRGVGFLVNKSFFYENRTLQLSSIHNFWIELLIELGVVGLLIFLSFCFYLLWKAFKSKDRFILLSALVLSLVSVPLISTMRYFLFFYLLLGVSYYYASSDRKISY
jgi:O-antigen ligase